jgi:hypothetical protein
MGVTFSRKYTIERNWKGMRINRLAKAEKRAI